MQLAEVIAYCRILMAEPNTNRWTDSYLTTLITNSCRTISTDIEFPEATTNIGPSVIGQREYQMVECVQVLRAYYQIVGVTAQLLVGTTIGRMEGDQLGIYDQRSGTIVGYPQDMPIWMAETSQSYPVNSYPLSAYVSGNSPYQSVQTGTQRPMLYRRGGFLGLAPPPAVNGHNILVDFVPIHPDLVATSQQTNLMFPSNFKTAIARLVLRDVYEADGKQDMADRQAAYYANDEKPRLLSWKSNVQGNAPKAFIPRTMRSFTRDARGRGWM